MNWSTSILLLGMVYGLQYALNYRDWLDLSKDVTLRTAPGPCTTVIEDGGSEDIVDIGNNVILITVGFDINNSVGTMKALDLTTNKVWSMNMTNAPSRPDFMASPHGMARWRDDKTGELFVYVITHPAKEDRIEVFKVIDRNTLQYIKTITDPSFTFMNDLIVVGKDKFYITKFWRARQLAYIFMEIHLRISNGAIMYYDGYKARELASGFFMPNGISASPDQSMIYMAEFGNKKLVGYRRESTNNLVKAWEMDMETAVDNIDVDPDTGDLWIGAHPHLYKVMDLYNWFGFTKPSQVLRVKIRDGAISEVTQPYSDSGHEIEGSTAAAYINGKLVIGSVSRQMIVCDVNYLSP